MFCPQMGKFIQRKKPGFSGLKIFEKVAKVWRRVD
tara:strand:- start:109 stop:213 length:105 start_codon:yes stop_codon:yes gene_type:complete